MPVHNPGLSYTTNSIIMPNIISTHLSFIQDRNIHIINSNKHILSTISPSISNLPPLIGMNGFVI
eukprot:gnl/Chilomastix_caulleri/7272.p1 GENE.gnl/Chilomastix_caulleri/7272~~gnl/Chilomastix_caulleri/7272.p1  ORF type:complete len:65 (-),score=14.59 gnl/Chilomastix_caulleri/7272:73-267(-)